MKMRKFFGLTSRSVLEQVRTELGPDAVILDNRSTADGIEVTALAGAAMENIFRADAVPPTGTPRTPAPDAAPPRPSVADVVRAQVEAFVPAAAQPVIQSVMQPVVQPFVPLPAQLLAQATVQSAAAPVPTASDAPAEGISGRLMAEVGALRNMLEQQLAQFAWNDTLRRTPQRAAFLRDLLHAGFGADLARSLVQRLPEHLTAVEAQQWIAREIAGGVHCAGPEEDLVTQGGIYALTGATGVGKTTTAAKLAARCAVRHGASSLALLTTDSYRVGAHDQLRIYARILGVTVHTVNGTDDLRQALDSLRAKHLVLVDTVGMGQRDPRVREHAMLLAQPEVRRLIVLAATAQAETLEEVVRAYRPAADGSDTGFAGCIVTKLDEAVRLGDAVDVLVRHRLPLHYLSTGQRVPEDLHVPNVHYLVHRALRSGAKSRARMLEEREVGLVLGGGSGAFHA